PLQVGAGLFLAGEKARAFQHDVHAQLAPGQGRGIAVGQHADLVAVDDHVVAVDGDRAGKLAMGGVETGQVGIGLGIAQVVDRHDLDVVLFTAFIVGPQNIAADAAITVDRHAYRHCYSPVYKTCSTAAATRSAVRPKCLNSAPAGADSP